MKSRPKLSSTSIQAESACLNVKQYEKAANQYAEEKAWQKSCDALLNLNQALLKQYESKEMPINIKRHVAKNYIKMGDLNLHQIKNCPLALTYFKLAESTLTTFTHLALIDHAQLLSCQFYIAEIYAILNQSKNAISYANKILSYLGSATAFSLSDRASAYGWLYVTYSTLNLRDPSITFLRKQLEILHKISTDTPTRNKALIRNQLNYASFYYKDQNWPYMLDALHTAITIMIQQANNYDDEMKTVFDLAEEVRIENLDKKYLEKLFSIYTMLIIYYKKKDVFVERFLLAIFLQHETKELLETKFSGESALNAYDVETLSKELRWRFLQIRYIDSTMKFAIPYIRWPTSIALFYLAKLSPYTLKQGLETILDASIAIEESSMNRLNWVNQFLSMLLLYRLTSRLSDCLLRVFKPSVGFSEMPKWTLRNTTAQAYLAGKRATKVNFDLRHWQNHINLFVGVYKGKISGYHDYWLLGIASYVAANAAIYGEVSPAVALYSLYLLKCEIPLHFRNSRWVSQCFRKQSSVEHIKNYFNRAQHRLNASFKYLSVLLQDCDQGDWKFEATYLNLQGNFVLKIEKFGLIPAAQVLKIISYVCESYQIEFTANEDGVSLSIPGNVQSHPDVSDINFEIINLLNQYHLVYEFSKQLDRIQIALNNVYPALQLPRFRHELIDHITSSPQRAASIALSHAAIELLTMDVLNTIFRHATIRLQEGELHITGYEPGSTESINNLIEQARRQHQSLLTKLSPTSHHAALVPLSGHDYAEFKQVSNNNDNEAKSGSTAAVASTTQILKKITWPSASYDPDDANCKVYPVKSDHFPLGTCFITLDEKAFNKTTPAIREDFARVAQEASHTDRVRGQGGIIYLNKEDKITIYRGNPFYANAKMKSLTKRTGDVRIYSRKEPEIAVTGEKLDVFHKIITKAHK